MIFNLVCGIIGLVIGIVLTLLFVYWVLIGSFMR